AAIPLRRELETRATRPARVRTLWFRKPSAVADAVARGPSCISTALALFFIRLREMRRTVWRGRKMRAHGDGLFRWLMVGSEHISLLTGREGSLRVDPFRHPPMGVEQGGR